MRIRSTANRVLTDVSDIRQDTERPEEGSAGEVLLMPGGTPLNWLARAAFDAEDPVARMARSLRGTIAAAATPGGAPIRSVGVIGIDCALEASIVAANLAIVHAQLGTPTVLVDANVQLPRQHLLFGIARTGGLIAALRGEESARSLAEQTVVKHLAVLPAGSPHAQAQVLLDGERFHRRAMPLLESFGTMVVDVGAPFGEPPALCEALDAVVLLVRRNVTPLTAVRNVSARLGDMKTLVAGTIIAE